MRKNNIRRTMTAVLAATMIMSSAACGSNETSSTVTSSTQACTEDGSRNDSSNNTRQESTTTAQVAESTQAPMYEYEACDEDASINQLSGASNYKAGARDINNCAEVDIDYEQEQDFYTNEYNDLAENPWQTVKTAPLSTFAADVDTASYSQIRSGILNGYGVDPGQVRIEELFRL